VGRLYWIILIILLVILIISLGYLGYFYVRQRVSPANNKGIYVFGRVKSWDYGDNKLVFTSPGGAIKTYLLNTSKVPILVYDVATESAKQKLIMDRLSDDWKKAFCPEDIVKLSISKASNIAVLQRVTNLGPRNCAR